MGKLPIRTCGVCGEPFQPNQLKQMLCGKVCSKRLFYRNLKTKPKTNKRGKEK